MLNVGLAGRPVPDPGGGQGVRTPLLGHDVGFLTLGPKLGPLLNPPFFACRPKMDPSGGSRVCVCDRGDHPAPPPCLWMPKSGGVFQFFWGRMTSHGQCPRGGVLVKNPVSAPGRPWRRLSSIGLHVLMGAWRPPLGPGPFIDISFCVMVNWMSNLHTSNCCWFKGFKLVY